uniref:EB domain-containing protein n=1 Tax=Ditylenchus dipsaci TaxID=166011 RepID=A0A915E928_9BILA
MDPRGLAEISEPVINPSSPHGSAPGQYNPGGLWTSPRFIESATKAADKDDKYYYKDEEYTESEEKTDKNYVEVEELEENLLPKNFSSAILPGFFCDEFSGCGKGAECLEGVCRCLILGQHLAFVNGSTRCVSIREQEKRPAG